MSGRIDQKKKNIHYRYYGHNGIHTVGKTPNIHRVFVTFFSLDLTRSMHPENCWAEATRPAGN